MFGMWFVITMALGGVANHVLNPSAGRGMGYLAIAIQFGFAFAFPVSEPCAVKQCCHGACVVVTLKHTLQLVRDVRVLHFCRVDMLEKPPHGQSTCSCASILLTA